MTDQPAGQSAELIDALLDAARAWLAVDPDADTRAELEELVAAADAGDAAPLAERFAGRLQFGTAGLRGELGAGPMRMNRVTVRRATAGLVRHLLAREPEAAERGIVIGYDARHKSDAFARDAAAVAAGLGMRAMVMPGPGPTPVLAWSVPHLGAVAGVMVTASHNPPRDNGYKVYLDDGSQIVSPVDVDIAASIDAVDLAAIVLAAADDPLVVPLDASPVEAYLDAVPAVRLVPELERCDGRVHADARRGRGHAAGRLRTSGVAAPDGRRGAVRAGP